MTRVKIIWMDPTIPIMKMRTRTPRGKLARGGPRMTTREGTLSVNTVRKLTSLIPLCTHIWSRSTLKDQMVSYVTHLQVVEEEEGLERIRIKGWIQELRTSSRLQRGMEDQSIRSVASKKCSWRSSLTICKMTRTDQTKRILRREKRSVHLCTTIRSSRTLFSSLTWLRMAA